MITFGPYSITKLSQGGVIISLHSWRKQDLDGVYQSIWCDWEWKLELWLECVSKLLIKYFFCHITAYIPPRDGYILSKLPAVYINREAKKHTFVNTLIRVNRNKSQEGLDFVFRRHGFKSPSSYISRNTILSLSVRISKSFFPLL